MQELYLSRELLEFIPKCQWPDIQLPVPQAMPPPQPLKPSVNEEVLKGLQSTHDASIDMLCTQGIDACQVYKEKDASTILAYIRPKEVKCSFCGRVCKTAQKLKVHIRPHHLRSATYKCPVCEKGFGDPYALSQHKKSHKEGGKKYLCAVCAKGFVTKSQVNEHSKRCQQGRVSCAHCTKSLADKKTLQDHLKVCSQCPQPSQQVASQRSRPNHTSVITAVEDTSIRRICCATCAPNMKTGCKLQFALKWVNPTP